MNIRCHNVERPNDKAEPQPTQNASPLTDAQSAVGSSDLLDSLDEAAINKLLNEQNQNPDREPEYGSLEPIGKFRPDWEIQNDGHGRFVQVPPHTEEHKLEQNHPMSQKEQSHRNNAESQSDQLCESKSIN